MRNWTKTLPALAAAIMLVGCATLTPSVTLEDIEDEGFRTYLADAYDANADGRLDADECASVTSISFGSEYPVESLDVRDAFPALESVDVSCPTLVSASLSSSAVTSVDLSGCGALASFDISAPALERIDVTGTPLSSLDLTASPHVTEARVGKDMQVKLANGLDEESAGLVRLRTHEWSYTWSNEIPAAWGLAVSEAAFEVWYPVFTMADDPAASESVNSDVAAHVRSLVDTYNEVAAPKPWGYVNLYPEVTVLDDGYVAIHYYQVVSGGTTGTSYVAGSGSIYRLSDGAVVSPAEVLGISYAELLQMTKDAVAASGIEEGQSPSWDTGEIESIAARLADGSSEYVLLPEGLYVSYHSITNWGNDQAFVLIGICSSEHHDFDPVRGKVVDLSYEMGRYGTIDRSQGQTWTVEEGL